jgi:hypothetical protein
MTEVLAPTPFELVRWQMAEKFGWTLETIDGLSMDALAEYLQVVDGMNKAAASRRKL